MTVSVSWRAVSSNASRSSSLLHKCNNHTTGVFRLLRKHSDLRNHNCSLFSPTLPNPLVYLNKTQVWAIAAWPSVKSALSRYQISLPCSMPVMIAINSQCVGLRLSDSFLYYLKSIKKRNRRTVVEL